jgi:hypothetical protein
MVIVTHSPFMVSSMKDSSVYVLRFADTRMSSEDQNRPRLAQTCACCEPSAA